jgi:hypothetical protein
VAPKASSDAHGHLRLTHAGELIAVAEPRGELLKPLVVFAE